MKAQLTRNGLIALTLVAVLASSASAAILHDQSAIETDPQGGFNNSVVPGFNGFTIYGMSDVVVGGTGWVVESITIYRQLLGVEPTLGYINVLPKTSSPLPMADQIPNQDMAVALTATYVPGSDQYFAITASGLNIELEPGEYWIGLTPVEDSFFYSIHLPAATQIGDFQATYVIDPLFGDGWGNYYRDWDATILIEGRDDVVATENMTMGAVKALFR